MLLAAEDEGGDDRRNEGYELEEEVPEILLHALSGCAINKTMRVKAKVGPHVLNVMVDSGSTHNFISERIAKLLQLKILDTSIFSKDRKRQHFAMSRTI